MFQISKILILKTMFPKCVNTISVNENVYSEIVFVPINVGAHCDSPVCIFSHS